METRHALIVGAGIGGPVLALGLRRLGMRVTLVDRRGRAADAEGAFLGLAPNGMHALAALDAAGPVARLGFPCSAFHFRSGSGRSLGVIDRSRDVERFGWPLTMVRRGELHRVLLEQAEAAGAGVQLERTFRTLEQRPGKGVVAHFEQGPSIEADMLFGCDGLRSRVRAAAFPGAPPPAFSGLWDYGGFARIEGTPLRPGVNEMVFGKRAFFGAFLTPAGEVWWFHNGPEKLEGSPEAMIDGLCRLHADDPPWICEVLRATPEPLGPWGLYDLQGVRPWSNGRVCLLGDAAHAMSPSAGQGASLAMEDALALTLALRDNESPEAAFAAYERFRRDRVETIARVARRNGSGKAPGPIGRRIRDLVLPFFLRLGGRAQDRGYAWRFGWETRVSL